MHAVACNNSFIEVVKTYGQIDDHLENRLEIGNKIDLEFFFLASTGTDDKKQYGCLGIQCCPNHSLTILLS
jgi:hypothetical protein